jgi:zinc transporter 9
MFFLTFLFGFLPTKIQTSKRIMNLIAIFGAGLLVGAALEVIIPEGVITLIDSFKIDQETAHTHLI